MSTRFSPCPPVPAAPGPAVVILLQKNRIALTGDSALPRMADLPETAEFFHIGQFGDIRCCAAILPENAALPAGLLWQETRSGFLAMDPAERIAAGRAKTLLFWQGRRQYCGVCGAKLAPQHDECARKCPECGAQFFPVLAPAMIVAVHRENQILLAHNVRFQPGVYSILAGFVEAGESVEEAVAREVREEVGIEIGNIRYFGSQSWPYPNSLMLGFEADYVSGDLRPDGVEITDAGWYTADALPSHPAPGSIAYRLIRKFLAEN